jgi:hypothetical protein
VIPTVGNVEGFCSSGVWSFETDTNYTPVFALDLELSKSELSIEQGQFESIDITVTNNGDVDDLIKLVYSIEPSSLDKKNVVIGQTEFSLTSHNSRSTTLTINIPKDAKTGDYRITVTAISQGALGLNQDISNEKTLKVEVLEEVTAADQSLYLGSIAVLIIIIVILIVLFLITVRKKKQGDEETEDRVALKSVPGPEEVLPPMAPPVEHKPEGETPAPVASEVEPEAPPSIEEEQPPVPPEPESTEPVLPPPHDVEKEMPAEDEPIQEEKEAIEDFETEKEPISEDEMPVEEEPVAETGPIPEEETPEPETPPEKPKVVPKVTKPGKEE